MMSFYIYLTYMKTATVDILQDRAMNLLKDLEALNVIRLPSEDNSDQNGINKSLSAKYSGAMTKQPIEEVDKQLNDLRNEWD
jgi:hypothetical protein